MPQPLLVGNLQCDEQLAVDHEVFCTRVLDKRSTMFIAPEFKDIYLDWGCMEYDRVGRARVFCCDGYGFVASVVRGIVGLASTPFYGHCRPSGHPRTQ